MNGNIIPVLTEDGSVTLFNRELGEHYHSIHGAVQESGHVFIDAGFKAAAAKFAQITVLEIGFGTGLNALLTFMEAEKAGITVNYHTLEPFPIDDDTANSLNYCDLPGLEHLKGIFTKMHSAAPGTDVLLSPDFNFRKEKVHLQEYHAGELRVNLVYFDAFSPETAPELWKPEIFERLRQWVIPGGVLVTYSAKGEVRRSLQGAGFATERLPGPPGKREILRATAV